MKPRLVCVCWISLLGWSSGAWGARSAPADKIAVVTRAVGVGSDKAGALVGHFLTEVASTDKQVEVVDINRRLGGAGEDKGSRAVSAAHEMLAKGRTAYESLDLDVAIDHLNTALSKYERNAAWVSDLKKVSEALMLLGATHVLRGEDKAGAKRLAQALALDPKVEPDPRIFNPSMRRSFQDALQVLATRPTGSISIASNPSYADVYLNGRFVGVTPMAVSDVLEGRHYLRVARTGYQEWGRVVEVTSQIEAAEVATLKPCDNFEEFEALVDAAVPALPNKTSGDGVGESFRRLGDLLGVRRLLLAEVRLDGERVRALAVQVDVAKAQVVKSSVRIFPYEAKPDTYRREVEALLAGESGPVEETKKTEVESRGNDGIKVEEVGPLCAGLPCDTFKLVVSGAAAGAGAVFAGLAFYFGQQAGSVNDEFRKTQQTNSQVAKLESNGKTKALLANVFLGVGVAAAVAGVLVYFLWQPTLSVQEVAAPPQADWSWQLSPGLVPGGGLLNVQLDF